VRNVPASECFLTYEVFGDGTVECTLTMDKVEALGDMPEFGTILRTKADLAHVRYYGFGPEENYVDRMEGAKLGIYETTAAANMTQYLVPQESGGRCGVRWAEVTDDKGYGLRFEGDGMFLSVLPYSPHEVENARHHFELPQIHYTWIRTAKAQMGIAGDDSWGSRTLPQYLIHVEDTMTFTFRFRGI